MRYDHLRTIVEVDIGFVDGSVMHHFIALYVRSLGQCVKPLLSPFASEHSDDSSDDDTSDDSGE